jgi:hypothetical protein
MFILSKTALTGEHSFGSVNKMAGSLPHNLYFFIPKLNVIVELYFRYLGTSNHQSGELTWNGIYRLLMAFIAY